MYYDVLIAADGQRGGLCFGGFGFAIDFLRSDHDKFVRQAGTAMFDAILGMADSSMVLEYDRVGRPAQKVLRMEEAS